MCRNMFRVARLPGMIRKQTAPSRVVPANKRRQCELVHRPAQNGRLFTLHCSLYRYLQFSPAEKPGFCVWPLILKMVVA
jgi:hypothetical protein